MASSECKISCPTCANALVELKPRLPRAHVTPAISCLRVGLFAGSEFIDFLSLIFILRLLQKYMTLKRQGMGPRGQNMFKIMFYWRALCFLSDTSSNKLRRLTCPIPQDTAMKLERKSSTALAGSSTATVLTACL